MIAYYLIIFGTVFLILYAYRAVHLSTDNLSSKSKRLLRLTFLLLSILIYGTTTYIGVNYETYSENKFLMNYAMSGSITLSVTLLSICIFQLLADLVLLGRVLFYRSTGNSDAANKLSRRSFINKLALGMGGVMLGSFIWGLTKGKYGWRVVTNTLSFENLPQAFDGLKIVQISDLHLGSFNKNFEPLEEAIQIINELEPDYIFFTGDLVNEKPDEAEPWINVVRQLKAKSGKYAILGNHDYGWGEVSEQDKVANSKKVAQINKRMGFKVLLNEHDILEKDGEKIGLVGVENWGFSEENWFPTKGDYKKAAKEMEDVPFKILLSHDPTHWDHHILGKENVDLTLSGHTHGGQMGITIPGILEISAARLFYKRYAGSYKEGKQHLYVNRGMGFLIFPGRVGMPPEITLHQLHSA
ncbi:MAG: metallophosphoesterase [Flavobacteriales bacterium]|nr:metallophosphoesterase [Flavobacteriales bacterium]